MRTSKRIAANAFTASVLIAFASGPAGAAVQNGQYGFWLPGQQRAFGEVCLQGAQIWYGLTFDGGPQSGKWGGYWDSSFGAANNQIRIVGSFTSTDGIPSHDDITIDGRTMQGDWMRWSDTKNFFYDRIPLTMKFEKATCDR